MPDRHETPTRDACTGQSESTSFDTMISPLMNDLYRFAYWLCRDREQAKDLVQETLLRAWRFKASLRDRARAKAWLFTTLRREHARTYERKQLQRSAVDITTIPDDYNTGPEAFVERRELRQRISALRPDYREALGLKVLMGYTNKEVASAQAISQTAANVRIFRARNKLLSRTRMVAHAAN